MRAVSMPPGTTGRSMTYVRAWTLAIVVAGLCVLCTPGSASAAGSMRAAVPTGPTPSPHPDPAGRVSIQATPSASASHRPAVPSPIAPAPPVKAPGPTTVGVNPARTDLTLGDNSGVAAVARPEVRNLPRAAPADLSRSLVYSGALALTIAGSGLILVGFRRQLW